MASQVQIVPGPGPAEKLAVYYEGSDTIYPGYALCANADSGTVTAKDGSRRTRAEKPSSGNLHNFLGVVAPGRSAWHGPCYLEVVRPGCMCNVYTSESCTLGTTILTVVPDSYTLGGIGEGYPVALAHQTVDRSTDNGLAMAMLTGIGVDSYLATARLGTPAAATNVLSAAIWETCPWDLLRRNPGLGYTLEDEFYQGIGEDPDNATVFQDARFLAFGVTGVTFDCVADELGGVCEISMDADDEEFYIATGRNAGGMCKIVADSGKNLWLEGRVKVGQIEDDYGFFFGLAEQGIAVTGAMAADAASIVVKDFIGFEIVAGDGDAMNAVHITQGGARVEVEAAVHVPVADAYVNLGLHFNGATLVTYYVNGVAVGTAAPADTNFPDGEELVWTMGARQHGAGTVTAAIDWLRFAQLR